MQAAADVKGNAVLGNHAPRRIDAAAGQKARSLVDARKYGSVIASEAKGQIGLFGLDSRHILEGMHAPQICIAAGSARPCRSLID